VTDENPLLAYEATSFWAEGAPGGSFCIRCGERCPELDRLLADRHLSEWAYVTACNPGSERLRDEENARRMRDLEDRLRGLPLVVFHGRASERGVTGRRNRACSSWASGRRRPARSGPRSARVRS
jgi:hypothetical protein